MITRKPEVGDRIEYNPNRTFGQWKDAGVVVAVIGNLCYTHDESLPPDAHKKYFGSSRVPPGCEHANNGFIWNFKDTMNTMHRIKTA